MINEVIEVNTMQDVRDAIKYWKERGFEITALLKHNPGESPRPSLGYRYYGVINNKSGVYAYWSVHDNKTKIIELPKMKDIKELRNTKVYVNGKAEELQKKLFSLGFIWNGSEKAIIEGLDFPFLFIYNNSLTRGKNMKSFSENIHKEISADFILNNDFGNPEEEKSKYSFKPFDNVIYKDTSSNEWKAGIYSHYNAKAERHVINGFYCRSCLPFKGNEHLLGNI